MARHGNTLHGRVTSLVPVRPCLRTALLLVSWACGLAWPTLVQALPSFDQVKAAYRSSDTVLLDRHGQPLQSLRTDHQALRGPWTTLPQVSPAFRQALLVSEDKRFYQHAGVDWRAVGAAAWGNVWNTRTRGASTVTMQLVGLLDDDLAMPTSQSGTASSRSLVTKIGQASTAWRLERQWRKDQILEAYLNLVAFRGEVVGISALSHRLFRKYPSGLNAEESAIAAVLVRGPNAPAARVAERACQLLREQGRKPHCPWLSVHTQQVLAALARPRTPTGDQLAPHLARQWARLQAFGATVAPNAPHMAPPAGRGAWSATPPQRTTLDARLQRLARDTLRQHLGELQHRNVQDGALLVLDNATGEVLAWVGSSGGELSQAGEVDGVLALRQAGSTLKPFLYGMAIEQRWLTAASVLDDSPVGLNTGSGLYIPQNYDRSFKGHVTLRTALGASLNVPAVRTLVMVSPEAFGQRLRALGLPLKHEGGHYGYSLALGSAEVTLASLTNAYRALANGGRYSPWRIQLTGTHAHASTQMAPMAPEAAYIVADILADREARVPTFGLNNALATRYWSAVKTGTSKDMRDNWCVGFSKRYTVGVWVGNANGDPMWHVSGTTGAAPIWRAVMDELHRRTPDAQAHVPPPAPPGVVQQHVRFEKAIEPERTEWFVQGTEQPEMRLASAAGAARTRIQSPGDRTTLFALDPDIPLRAQQLPFKLVAGVPRRWHWRLNGKRLGPAVNRTWPMWPGKHVLELVDERQQVKETVRFEVRGAQVKGVAVRR